MHCELSSNAHKWSKNNRLRLNNVLTGSTVFMAVSWAFEQTIMGIESSMTLTTCAKCQAQSGQELRCPHL